jgi:hypothetical protein
MGLLPRSAPERLHIKAGGIDMQTAPSRTSRKI